MRVFLSLFLISYICQVSLFSQNKWFLEHSNNLNISIQPRTSQNISSGEASFKKRPLTSFFSISNNIGYNFSNAYSIAVGYGFHIDRNEYKLNGTYELEYRKYISLRNKFKLYSFKKHELNLLLVISKQLFNNEERTIFGYLVHDEFNLIDVLTQVNYSINLNTNLILNIGCGYKYELNQEVVNWGIVFQGIEDKYITYYTHYQFLTIGASLKYEF